MKKVDYPSSWADCTPSDRATGVDRVHGLREIVQGPNVFTFDENGGRDELGLYVDPTGFTNAIMDPV